MSETTLDKKISALPEVTGASLTDVDKFPVVAGGVTSFIKKAELATVFGGGGGGTVVTPPAEGRTVPDATTFLANNAVYNIKDFGAVGDDVANDTAAITAAVNAARLNGGGRIYIPVGTYKTNATRVFDIDFSNVEIFGEGRGSIIKLYADGNLDATDKWGVAITGVTSNVMIRDLAFLSALAVNTSRQNAIGSPSGQTLSNIHVINVEVDSTILGVSLNGNGGSLRRGSVRNCYIHNIKGGVSGTGYGIHVDDAKEVIVDGNTLDNCGRHSIYQARSSDGSSLNNIISNNRILNHRADLNDGGFRAAISCSRSVGVTIIGNQISGGYDGGIEVSHTTADPLDYNTSEIAILNNTFTNRRNTVAYIIIGEQQVPTVTKTSNVLIAGNKFDDDASVATFQPFIYLLNGVYVTINNNTFRRINCNTAVAQRAISLANPAYANALTHCDHILVRDNTFVFEGTDLTDVRVINIDSPLANNPAKVTILDNHVVGGTSLDYYDTARTNTSMRVQGNNMPSSSATADAGFYIGNTLFTAGGGGATPPGGSDTQLQYNNGGAFGGAANLNYNDSTGNVGVGDAAAADTLFQVAAARALQKLAFFNNSAVDGFGVRIQNGANDNYALKISDASSNGIFQVFGRGLVHFGEDATSLLTALKSNNAFYLSVEGDATRANAGLVLTSGDHKITSMLYMTGGDRGMRLSWNYREPYQSGGTQMHSDPNYPVIQMQWETDGAFGMEYTRPFTSSASTYDSLPGKSWKLYGAGNPAITGANLGRKDKYILMTVGEPGRGFDFGVETAGDGTGYGTRFRIDDSSNADPIYLWVGGSLKHVTVDGSGFLKAT